MHFSKIFAGAVAVVLVAGLFWFFRYNDKAAPLKEPVAEAQASQKNDPTPKNQPSDETLQVNATQAEIAEMSDEAIAKEVLDLRTLLQKDDLVGRLKRNEASEEEKVISKKWLVRLALMSAEKSKRAMIKNKPAQAPAANAEEPDSGN